MTTIVPPAGDVPAIPDDDDRDVHEISVDVTPTSAAGEPPAVLVAVQGELDVGSVPRVAAQLRELAASGTAVSLDLSQVTFASSELVRMLVAEPVGEIVAVSRAVDRVLALSGDVDLRRP
jgi:anti-anti-sigma factor